MSKHPLEMLVKLLVNGEHVEHKGHTHALSEDGNMLVQISEESWANVECDVKALYRMAEDIGRDELWLRCCALSLRQSNEKDRSNAKGD